MSTAIWDDGRVFMRLGDGSPVTAIITRYATRILNRGEIQTSAPTDIAPGDVAIFESKPAYTPEGFDYRRYVVRLRGLVVLEWDDLPVRASWWRRVWDRVTTWDVRPRVLRRAMALIAFGAILAGTGVGWAASATADPVDRYAAQNAPNVCTVLDNYPTFDGIAGIADAIVQNSNLTYRDAGEVIATAVITVCPQHIDLIKDYVRAYAGGGSTFAAAGKVSRI